MTNHGSFTPGPHQSEEVLRTAAVQGFTGRIDMTSTTGEVGSIWFTDGAIRASSVPGPRPRLGVRLLSAGLVDPESLDQALREQGAQRDPEPLGDILVRLGAVERDEVEHVAGVQVIDQLADLLGWGSDRHGEIPRRSGTRSARDAADGVGGDGGGRAPPGRVEQTVRRLGGPTGVPRPSMLAAPRANLLLGPYDWAVLTKVDGLRTLEMLADHCGLSIYETAQIVEALAAVGLLVLPSSARRPNPATGAMPVSSGDQQRWRRRRRSPPAADEAPAGAQESGEAAPGAAANRDRRRMRAVERRWTRRRCCANSPPSAATSTPRSSAQASSSSVTGPSLTRLTCMSAPKRPVCTWAPR